MALSALLGCTWSLRPVGPRSDAGADVSDAPMPSCDVAPWEPDACPRPQVRFAHVAPNVPAVDLCVRPASAPDGGYLGPIFRASRPGGIAYGQVSQYFEGAGAAGTSSLRVVRGGGGCDAALADGVRDVVTAMPLACRAQVTLALVGTPDGTGDLALRVRVMPELGDADREPTRALVRFAHMAPDLGAVDVAVEPPGFTLWSDVRYGAVGVASALLPSRCFGYVAFEPTAAPGETLVRAARSTGVPLLRSREVLAPDTVYSAFLVGLRAGAGDVGLATLFCQDRPARTSSDGLNPTCRLVR